MENIELNREGGLVDEKEIASSEKTNKFTNEDLKILQSLPLEIKINKTEAIKQHIIAEVEIRINLCFNFNMYNINGINNMNIPEL